MKSERSINKYINANDSENPPTRKNRINEKIIVLAFWFLFKANAKAFKEMINEIKYTPVAETQNQSSTRPAKKKKNRNDVMNADQ